MRLIQSSIENDLLAYFWISLTLDENCVGKLDTSQIEYEICDLTHNPLAFWESTQYLIYQAVGKRESLMGILYNKLKHKKTIHFACSTTRARNLFCDIDVSDTEIFLNVQLPEMDVFDDSYLLYTCAKKNTPLFINHLIDNGYDFAERHCFNSCLSSKIANYAKDITCLLQKKVENREDIESLYQLVLLSLAYTYPTTRFDNKIFSAILSSYKEKNEELSSGGLFLLWSNKLCFNDIRTITSSIEYVRLLNDVYKYCSDKTTSSLLAIAQKQKEVSLKESIKAAKAAIMSRNMSHNLGSHVMAYIKQQLASVSDIVRTHVLDDLCTITDYKQLQQYTESVEMPFLVGLSRFINYLQERQDYIATISTDYIPALSTISFKDFIYDELKPDLRYERHHEANDPKGRKPKNLLLDYIAYSEGYKESKTVELYFGDFFGKKPIGDSESAQNKSFNDLRKLEVALPGGIIGRQALFSIIENIIRNAAKHSYKNKKHTLPIAINELILESGKEREQLKGFCYALEKIDDTNSKICYVEDNLDELSKIKKFSSYYHFITITNCLGNDLDQVKKVQKTIYTPYVNEDATMNPDCKGIKEIRISAAWIRSFPLDIDMKDEPNAVYIRAVDSFTLQPVNTREPKRVALQYLICIPKPRRVAIITDLRVNSKRLEYLADKGCAIFSSDTAVECYNDYEVIVLDDEIAKNINERYLTARVLRMETEEIYRFVQVTDGESLERQIANLHKETFKQKFPNNVDARVSIFDCKVSSDSWINDNTVYGRLIYYGTPSLKKEDFKDNVIYSTHYEGLDKEKSRGDKGCDADCIRLAASIEGISGNNSTDRLVRKNLKNEEWLYRHLLAGMTRVAIFDERMFDYVAPTIKRIGLLKDVADFLDGISQDMYESPFRLRDYISSRSGGLYRGKIAKEIQMLICRYQKMKEAQDFVRLEEIVLDINNSIIESYDVSLLKKYFEKRTHFYNIHINTDKKEAQIWGYTAPLKTNSVSYDSSNRIDIVACISKKNGEYHLKLIDEKKSCNVFDFILIHQGLLDKIYNMFEIGESDVEDKHKITKLLFDNYSKPEYIKKVISYIDEKGMSGYYLPQFIIHSGRSKPEYKDMPHQQPFIPFAAVENAIKDCKYTLSELLYSNHYEPNKKKK